MHCTEVLPDSVRFVSLLFSIPRKSIHRGFFLRSNQRTSEEGPDHGIDPPRICLLTGKIIETSGSQGKPESCQFVGSFLSDAKGPPPKDSPPDHIPLFPRVTTHARHISNNSCELPRVRASFSPLSVYGAAASRLAEVWKSPSCLSVQANSADRSCPDLKKSRRLRAISQSHIVISKTVIAQPEYLPSNL